MVVVLPAPLGPRKPKTSPADTDRSTLSMPRDLPYVLVSARVSMAQALIWQDSSVLPGFRRDVCTFPATQVTGYNRKGDHRSDLDGPGLIGNGGAVEEDLVTVHAAQRADATRVVEGLDYTADPTACERGQS